MLEPQSSWTKREVDSMLEPQSSWTKREVDSMLEPPSWTSMLEPQLDQEGGR